MKRYFKAFGYLLSVHVLALLVMTLFRLVEFIGVTSKSVWIRHRSSLV